MSSNSSEQNAQAVCIVCCVSKIGTSTYFAQCKHTGFCIKCCQSNLFNALKKLKYPTCLACSSLMIDNEQKCTFQYFTTGSKNSWKQTKAKIQQKHLSSAYCKVPDCQGLVQSGKCLKCLNLYCQKCFQPQHPGKCQKKNTSLTLSDLGDSFRHCPNCPTLIQKISGCDRMSCQCGFVFCFVCSQSWTDEHFYIHGAKGVRNGIIGWFQERFDCFNPSNSQRKKQ